MNLGFERLKGFLDLGLDFWKDQPRGNLNRIQFGIGPSASEKKRTQKTGSISFLNIFFMKWIQILLFNNNNEMDPVLKTVSLQRRSDFQNMHV